MTRCEAEGKMRRANVFELATLLENLSRGRTWFTEGSTGSGFRNAGTIRAGWLQRYGVDALIHESRTAHAGTAGKIARRGGRAVDTKVAY